MIVLGWVLVFLGWCIFTYSVFVTPRGTLRRRRALLLTLAVLGLACMINFAPIVVPD